MNQKIVKFGVLLLFQFLILFQGKTQVVQKPALSKRARENFDFGWLFHKGDITIKRVIKAGGQAGLTDINVKIITEEDTTIDYTNIESAKILFPRYWREVNLPHDASCGIREAAKKLNNLTK